MAETSGQEYATYLLGGGYSIPSVGIVEELCPVTCV